MSEAVTQGWYSKTSWGGEEGTMDKIIMKRMAE